MKIICEDKKEYEKLIKVSKYLKNFKCYDKNGDIGKWVTLNQENQIINFFCNLHKTPNMPEKKVFIKGYKIYDIDYDKTISFAVDPQKGFTSICPGELPVPEGDKIGWEIMANDNYAKYKGVSQDWHHPDAWHLPDKTHEPFKPITDRGSEIDICWPKHCEANTKGAELIPPIATNRQHDIVIKKGDDITKHPYGACFNDLSELEPTPLFEFLDKKNIRTVLLSGLAFDYCVKTTAIQLAKEGFEVIINMKATKALNNDPENMKQIKDELKEEYGVIIIDSLKELSI